MLTFESTFNWLDMAFVVGVLAKGVGDEHAKSVLSQCLLCTASLMLREMLWVSRQHLHCTCSTHGTLSQHEKGKGGGGKKVNADESASKSRLINCESRQVLVGDLQQRAWWTVCASAHKGSKKHPPRPFSGSVRQWAMHLLGTSCSAWPTFVMLKIYLWFPWVAFYTCGQKHEQLNIQQPENTCSKQDSEEKIFSAPTCHPKQVYRPPEVMEWRSFDQALRSKQRKGNVIAALLINGYHPN